MNSGTKVEFGFGVALKADGTPLSAMRATIGIQQIVRRAVELFGGCTIVTTWGSWVDPTGRHFNETGRTLIIYFTNNEDETTTRRVIRDMVNCIKAELDQQAVAVCMSEVLTDII